MYRGAKITILILYIFFLVSLFALPTFAGEHNYTDQMISDFYYRIINFVILLILLVFFLRKPLAINLVSRIKSIKNEITMLEDNKNKVLAELIEMKKKVEEAEKKHQEIIIDLRLQGEEEKRKIVADAEIMAIQIKAQAHLIIEQEIIKIKNILRSEVVQISNTLAKEILNNEITFEDHNKLINEYLSKIQ